MLPTLQQQRPNSMYVPSMLAEVKNAPVVLQEHLTTRRKWNQYTYIMYNRNDAVFKRQLQQLTAHSTSCNKQECLKELIKGGTWGRQQLHRQVTPTPDLHRPRGLTPNPQKTHPLVSKQRTFIKKAPLHTYIRTHLFDALSTEGTLRVHSGYVTSEQPAENNSL